MCVRRARVREGRPRGEHRAIIGPRGNPALPGKVPVRALPVSPAAPASALQHALGPCAGPASFDLRARPQPFPRSPSSAGRGHWRLHRQATPAPADTSQVRPLTAGSLYATTQRVYALRQSADLGNPRQRSPPCDSPMPSQAHRLARPMSGGSYGSRSPPPDAPQRLGHASRDRRQRHRAAPSSTGPTTSRRAYSPTRTTPQRSPARTSSMPPHNHFGDIGAGFRRGPWRVRRRPRRHRAGSRRAPRAPSPRMPMLQLLGFGHRGPA